MISPKQQSPDSRRDPAQTGGRAWLLIALVFGFLALVAGGFFAALKLTQPERSLMNTTATAEDTPAPAQAPPVAP